MGSCARNVPYSTEGGLQFFTPLAIARNMVKSTSVVVVAAFAAYFGLTWERAYTPSRDASTPPSLAELTKLQLGHQLHFVVIRSRLPKEKLASKPPVFLALHGGPGASDIPFMHKTTNILEEHFVVVHYDQRSSGKSCRFYLEKAKHSAKKHNLTIQGHVNDALELVVLLRQRFMVHKIYILGGSSGSVLALLMAKQKPDYFHHVAVTGLVVDTAKSEDISYQYVLDRHPEFYKIVPQPPPYGNERVMEMVQQRKWLHKSGGLTYRCKTLQNCSRLDLVLAFVKSVLQTKEMSWGDLFRFEKCWMDSMREMWSEVEKYKAIEQVPRLEVPLLVLHGRHDYCTAHTLVEHYVAKLDAPAGKRIVWFEKSGHSPRTEEPEKYQQSLIKTFLGAQ